MRPLAASAVLLLLAGCATAGGDMSRSPLDPRAEAPRSRALGAIVWQRDGQVLKRVSWDEARIAVGAGTGPAGAVLLRAGDGRWAWAADSALLEVGPDRIEGADMKLTMTRVEGGFRLQGIVYSNQFDLLLTREKAVAGGRVFLRGPDGS